MTSNDLLESFAESLHPDALQAYLRARGWALDGQVGSAAKVYVKSGEGPKGEVVVPTRPTAPDYGKLTRLLVERVATVERMTTEALLRDLSMAAYDVLRVRIVRGADGLIDLASGLTAIKEARATVLAAANAAASSVPRRNYAGRQAEQVSSFIDRVRLGQTEVGSFVVPLLTPYSFDTSETLSLLPGDWFGRNVMRKLVAGLDAVEAALIESDGSKDIEPFEERTSAGVSANLCQALGRLIAASGNVELGVRWATAEPEAAEPRSVCLSESAAPQLLRAAAHLAAAEPPPPEPVEGFVTKLVDAEAVIEAWIEGKLRKVSLEIPDRFRSTFADAWEARQAVAIDGDYGREGRRLRLTNVRSAEMVTGADE